MAPTVVHVVGARPNFVKMAPVISALEERADVVQRVVHTGQHYDARMSAEMLSDLEFPEPDIFLAVGSGSHGVQTARALEAFERVLLEEPPDLVCVGGDVNSTLAVALAAAKLGIPVAHVEAGLRSFDWTMPEEINRVLTDRLSDLLFTHSPEAATNLAAEGIDDRRVHFVGNTMIDSLRRFEHRAEERRPWEGARRPRRVRARDPAPPVERRRGRPAAARRGSARGAGRRRSRSLPYPSAHRGASAGRPAPVRPRACRRPVHGAGRLPRLPRPGDRRRRNRHRLRRGAGGGVGARRAVLHLASQYGASNNDHAGHQHAVGEDPAPIANIRPAALERRPVHVEGWDGHAGERAAGVIASHLGARRAQAIA